MKKFYVLTFFLLQFFIARGQTLKETQQWLKEKIESYGTNSTVDKATNITVSNTIQGFDFDLNDVVIIVNEDIIQISGENSCIVNKAFHCKFPFNKIISIEVHENGLLIKTANQITMQTIFKKKYAHMKQEIKCYQWLKIK